VKKGLPSRSLPEAEGAALKVWDAARRGVASQDAVATALGMKAASGGAWNRAMALLRVFGLIEVKEGGVSLSELGLDIVQDADTEKRRTARLGAFMGVRPYAELLGAYSGTDLPALDKIASKLRFDYGKTEEAAAQSAKAFVDSIRHVGLLAGNTVIGEPSQPAALAEDVQEVDRTDENGGADHDGAGDDASQPVTAPELEATVPNSSRALVPIEHSSATRDGAVTLSITLDLSGFRPDEVIQILRSVGLARNV
jgi:hypothetical protein